MSTFTISDAALVAHFNELVETKLAEATALPDAVANYHCEGDGQSGHGFDTFVLAGAEDAVKVSYDSAGHHGLVFANLRKPVYTAFLTGGDNIDIEFASDGQAPSMIDQLELAASLPVSLNELVPYGWVKDGRIIALIYGTDFNEAEYDGLVVIAHGLDCFVLEGEHLPAGLKMQGGFTLEWMDRIWSHIREGRLIRLTDRIKGLPEDLWAESDGSGVNWFRFDASDGLQPAFVTGKRYLDWHPIESVPGERFGDYPSRSTAYKNTLRGWFR